jgi:hypothetical protein
VIGTRRIGTWLDGNARAGGPASQRRPHPAKRGPDLRCFGVESYRGVLLHNWSREIHFRPELVFFPKSPADVIAIVEAAIARDKRISIMGKGYSWNPLMVGSEYSICTVDMNRVIDVDPRRGLVTVEPGATIAEVDAVLARHGSSIPDNIVGTTDITFGGLVATGSHGSGRDCVPMSDLMVAVEIVRPDGTLATFSDEGSGKTVMDALRLNLGLFGVMTKITLRAVPTYDVEVVDQRVPPARRVRAAARAARKQPQRRGVVVSPRRRSDDQDARPDHRDEGQWIGVRGGMGGAAPTRRVRRVRQVHRAQARERPGRRVAPDATVEPADVPEPHLRHRHHERDPLSTRASRARDLTAGAPQRLRARERPRAHHHSGDH